MRTIPLWLLVTLQAGVSAASLVVEIVAGRMLAPHVGMSLYTWTSVIAVVLAGFSAGHWWGGRMAERPGDVALRQTGWALAAAALTTGIATGLLHLVAGPVLASVGHPVWGIAILTGAVFFLPSLFAGVPAPVLAQIAVTNTDKQGRALGAIFAAGAVGAIAGTLLAGFLFISWLGSAATLAAVTVLYALSAALCLVLSGRRGMALPLATVLIGVLLSGLALASPASCDRESRYFCIRTVDISADPNSPVRLMVIDHLAHGISARDVPTVMFTDHAALLDGLARVRAPRHDFSSYFIGGGTYSIPRAFDDHGTGPVTVAEIDPDVTQIAVQDFWFKPETADILHEDARRALLTRPDARYDVIVGDAFTDVAVPAHLVTQEFFQLVADRLTPEGTFLMNLIDYEDRLHALGAMITTLRQVFPVVEVWTEARQPAPGSRMVFVLVAGQTQTTQASIRIPTPEQKTFAALSEGMVNRIAMKSPIILTDDFAPIDRLIGRPD